MTQTVLQLIKLLTDKGLPVTTAAGIYLPTKKAPIVLEHYHRA